MRWIPGWLLALALTSLALAHPFEGSGGFVQGQVDFEPNDAVPVAGRATVAWIEYIRVGSLPINPQDCFCTLLFYQGKVSATAQPDAQVRMQFNPRTGRVEGVVKFPKPGPYFLVLLGRPMPGKKVPAFIMNSIIQVLPR
ncbi:MAG: hypothetical protein KatS3mg074_566 [Meiothermus sp.]|uniref:Uncharacterized protein n=2 Tax=Meiothermus hypogaeus TaxID=884155 RepID=A0A511QXQ7_9DEIN|nr:hypothetical protein [Meiothermus hypogaeus]RIH79091.1 hypothetical protein Mhypo_01256 [Meiothermus hypogaeus]GEM82164.1 hypothetical protein MHY01S_03300 [Meiothermus hypogaeus NBRC 106114]GIW38168.1 MAG: hypothetical protein KatS3mg074_566 [Meiothermus sp.]